MIQTNCQACNKFFTAPQQMLNQGVHCPHCYAPVVMHFRPNQSYDPNSVSQLNLREQIKRFRVGFQLDGDSILVGQKGFERGDKIPLVIVSFLSFLLINLLMTFLVGQFAGIVGSLISTLTLVISFAIAFLLIPIYCGMVHSINRTIMRISHDEITFVDDGPLPWLKRLTRKRVDMQNVQQFFVETTFHAGDENSGPSVADSLSIVLEDKSVMPLVSLTRRSVFRWGKSSYSWSGKGADGFAEQLLALERLIEDFLGIQDQNVVVASGGQTTTYGSRTNNPKTLTVGSRHNETWWDIVAVLGLIALVVGCFYSAKFFSKANRRFKVANVKAHNESLRQKAFDKVYEQIFKAPPNEVVEKLPVHLIDRALQNRGFTLERMKRFVPLRNIRLYDLEESEKPKAQAGRGSWFIAKHTNQTPSFFNPQKISDHEFRTAHLYVRHAHLVKFNNGQRPPGMFFVSHDIDPKRQLPISYIVPDHVAATCLFIVELIERHQLSNERLNSKELYDWILKECQREFARENAPVTVKESFTSSKIDRANPEQATAIKQDDMVSLSKKATLTLPDNSKVFLTGGATFRVSKVENDKVSGKGLFPLAKKLFKNEAIDVVFGPRGKRIVSIGQDDDSTSKIVVWNLDDRTLDSLKRKGGATSIGFVPGSSDFFVSDYHGRVVHSWNLQTLKFRFGFRTEQRPRDLAFSSDGSFLVVGESGYHSDKRKRYFGPCVVSKWSTKERKRVQSYEGNERSVHAVDISSDDRLVLSVGKDKKFRIYNKSSKAAYTWPTPILVNDVLFFAEDKKIVCTGDSRSVHIFDANSGEQERKLDLSGEKGSSLAISPNKSLLACTDASGKLRVWSLGTFELLLEHQVGQSRTVGLDFSPDSQRIATASDDGVVTIWHIGKGKGLAGWVPVDSVIK